MQTDDELTRFAAQGAPPLPPTSRQGVVEHDGARIWYAALSPTPQEFDEFVAAVSLMMSSQPNYTAQELAAIRVPVTIVHSEHDEFIRAEHAAYLSGSIPGARLVTLPGVSHFAPLQRPAVFNRALLDFLADVMPPPAR